MYPQQNILRRRPRRTMDWRWADDFESTPPIALEQEALASKTNPWSERLPDGRTVNEAVMEALKGGTEKPSTSPAGMPRPLPEGGTPAIPALAESPSAPVPAPNVRVGQSVQGTSPFERERARLQQLLSIPSSSNVSTKDPDFLETTPPHPMSRKKAALLGLLYGIGQTAQGGRNTNLASLLGGGVTGLGIGLAHPKSIQDWRRRMEVEEAQGQLADQTKLLSGQAQLENIQANTAETRAGLMPDPNDPTKMIKRPPQRAPQYVERSDGVYEISADYPNGRRVGNIPAEVRSTRRSVHYEPREDGVYAIYEDESGQLRSTKVEGVPGKPASDAQAAQAAEGEAIAESTQAAADTLKAELDQQKGQLLENERAITQKEALWNSQAAKIVADSAGETKMADALAQVQAADPDYVKGTYNQTVNNTKALRDAVGDKEKRLASMAEDIRKGSAKAARSSRRGRRTLSSSQRDQIIEKAKSKGLDPNRAVQVAEDLLNR